METEPLVIRADRGAENIATCTLGNEPVTIGSWTGATLRLDTDEVLPVEVVLDPDGDGRLRLLALGADGCEVNGRRCRRAWVRRGDTVGVGAFVVRLGGLEASTVSPVVVESTPRSGAEQPLRATLWWRGARLDERHLRPGQTLTLGGKGATFQVPMAGSRVPIATCLDGAWHIALDADCRAFDSTGGASRPILCTQPRTDGPTGGRNRGGLWAPFPEGASVRFEAGDVAVELERSPAFSLAKIERTPWWTTPDGERSIIALMVGILLIAIVHNPPPQPFTGTHDQQPARVKEQAAALPRAVRLQEKFKPPPKVGKDPSAGAAKAKGAEGKAGRPDSDQNGRRSGPLSDEEVVKRSELFKALGGLEGAAQKLMGGGALGAATHLGSLDGAAVGDARGSGGLGLRGTGPGGGGLSADSVGVGPVNTQGVGAGAGKGRLKGSGASELGIDDPATVSGGLDREVIRRVILSHRAQIRYCYEKQLAKSSSLAGKLMVEFVIGADGRVTTSRLAEDTLSDPEVGRCVVSRVKGWTFPKPEGGGVVVVTYPFLFKPAGQGGK